MVKSLKKINRLNKQKLLESQSLGEQIDSHDLSSAVHFDKAMSVLEKMMTKHVDLAQDENAEEAAPEGNNQLGGGKSGFDLHFADESDEEDNTDPFAAPTKNDDDDDFLDLSEVNKRSHDGVSTVGGSGAGLKKNKGKVLSRIARRRKIVKHQREVGYSQRLKHRSLQAMTREIEEIMRKKSKRRRAKN